MKPYSEYKTTNLPWLPKIPKHWEVIRAKNLYIKASRPVSTNDEVVTCFRDGVVTSRKNRRISGFTESLKEIGYQGIKKGDLVIHVMDAFAGATGVSDSDGKGTPVYNVCVARNSNFTNNYYYAHAIRLMAKLGFIQSLYRGIRERSSDFRYEVFGNQLLPVPPIDEQDQIVRFLDWKVSKINKLIHAKKKQIALLKERKQAIINQAVTKGLNPNIDMKDSGIDWLGKIPKHWSVIRTGSICRIETGDQDTQDATCDGIYPFYVRSDFIKRSNRYTFQGEAVLTAGDGAGVGKVFHYVNEGKYAVHQRVYSLSHFSKNVNAKFFFRYFSNLFYHIALTGTAKSTVDSLRRYMLTDFILLHPPIVEQTAIVEYLDRHCRDIDVIIAQCEKEIALAMEYKNSLISSAVTGQIDLRNTKIEDVPPDDLIIDDDPEFESDDSNAPESLPPQESEE